MTEPDRDPSPGADPVPPGADPPGRSGTGRDPDGRTAEPPRLDRPTPDGDSWFAPPSRGWAVPDAADGRAAPDAAPDAGSDATPGTDRASSAGAPSGSPAASGSPDGAGNAGGPGRAASSVGGDAGSGDHAGGVASPGGEDADDGSGGAAAHAGGDAGSDGVRGDAGSDGVRGDGEDAARTVGVSRNGADPAADAGGPAAEEHGGCRGPGGRNEPVAEHGGEVVTARAAVPAGSAADAGADHDPRTPGSDRRGWRRLVPRRPWRWLGGLAALAALGSLAVGVVYVWLRGAGRGAPPGGGPAPSPSGTPGHGHPTPGETPGGGPGAHGTPGAGGHTTDPSSGNCSVQGVSCHPFQSACDSACGDLGSGCTAFDPSCGGSSCDDSGCGSSDPNCGNVLHTVSSAAPTLPYLHRTATDRPGVPARVGVAAIRAYQRISPGLPTRCRYTPTCSRYGVAAIQAYGLLAGARITVARIHRCTVDVVPGTADPLPA
ncbi:membrane protein insertion efficiency factor YidD [Actinocatenispora rupis]|uniref:Membrane protein insertion efficiency factor n=1 Tax=Actinocatenispora rupis TaxID=519421 RepID=A0A8J3J3W7_9ACTN|nr:membrane protein insertion efficiency factor YidD [Actinocatenispora rupis]GID11650.1 hypothetical protein Aru02nite_25390 [Actinocatenispora rupis]